MILYTKEIQMKNEELDALIQKWEESKIKLSYHKRLEMMLRKNIAEAYKISALPEGKSHFQTEEYMIELTRKFTYKLLDEELDEIEDDLSDEEKDCIKTKRSLSLSAYRALLDSSVIDDAIEVKDAVPSLTVTQIHE